MRYALIFACLASAAVAEDCPPALDVAPLADPLIAEVQKAPDEQSARVISNKLWEIWATAPNARAQEMLDRGMGRRAVYDFDAAEAAFEELIAYCPDYAEGYNQRAFVNFLRQDFGPALEDLDRALALSPRHVAAMSGKALTLMGLGRMDAGQAVLREALALNPWLPERGYLIEDPSTEL